MAFSPKLLPARFLPVSYTHLKARNTVLGDTEGLGHTDLSQLAGVPELAQAHFPRDELASQR